MTFCDETLTDFSRFLTTIGISSFPKKWVENIDLYYDFLYAQNTKKNLTSITNFDEFLVKHIVDSLLVVSVLPTITTEGLKIADVGSGAGLPGVPLALTFPNLKLTEIDSVRKKTNFTRQLVDDLHLNNCQTVLGRARELSRMPEFKGKCDIVLARAVSNAASLIRECHRFLKSNGGLMILYKTPKSIALERSEGTREARKRNLTVRESAVFTLPRGFGERQFLIVKSC
jgi:16S rRNA (guanine527-N7)-methyltransferase